MKHILVLTICLLLVSQVAYSQEYYRIQDSDGFVNLRLSADVKSKVIKEINSGECVVGFFSDRNWVKTLVFSLSSRTLVSGFIHNSRLVLDESCVKAKNITRIPEGEIAYVGLNKNGDFDQASLWFAKYRNRIADDGYFAEGYSAYVAKTLASEFSNSITMLNEINTSNPEFVKFVLKHADETASYSDLKKIIGKEKHCRNLKRSKICEQIILNAKTVLNNKTVAR